MWSIQYVVAPNVSRFQLPFNAFNDFVVYSNDGNYFPQSLGCNVAGKAASPLELMISGALRFLGRGWTFDDNEEATSMSEENHCHFFNKFIKFGSTILFNELVRTPQTLDEAKAHMAEFKLAGLPGTCTSSDAISIIHEMCLHQLQLAHKGFKMKDPSTQAYNLTANHQRGVLGTTSGYPGSFNDMTVILCNNFICNIKSAAIFDDHTFELLEQWGEDIVSIKYCGVCILVDNGYHNWNVTLLPCSNSARMNEIQWSGWSQCKKMLRWVHQCQSETSTTIKIIDKHIWNIDGLMENSKSRHLCAWHNLLCSA